MNRDYGKKCSPAKQMADGGRVSDEAFDFSSVKPAGEKVGFFDRLRAGNKDEAGSEANMRFGSGKVEIEKVEESSRAEKAEQVAAKGEPTIEVEPAKAPEKADANYGNEGRRTPVEPLKEAKKAAPKRPVAAVLKPKQPSKPAAREGGATGSWGASADIPVDPDLKAPKRERDTSLTLGTLPKEGDFNRGAQIVRDEIKRDLARRKTSTQVAKYEHGGPVDQTSTGLQLLGDDIKGAPEAAKPGQRVAIPAMGESKSLTGGFASGFSTGRAIQQQAKGMADGGYVTGNSPTHVGDFSMVRNGVLGGGRRSYGKKG